MGAYIQTSVICCCPSNNKQVVCLSDLDNSEIYKNSNRHERPKATTVKDIQIKKANIITMNTRNPEDIYEQISELGEGSFGRVIKVRHKETGDYRAIKIINKSVILDEIQEEDIESEIRILKELDHPYIIRLHEYFLYRNNLFIVSELVEGWDLFKVIEKYRPLSELIATKILFQLLSAVCYLHSQNIFHGDLKPENILIDNFKNVVYSSPKCDIFGFDIKLIDFGASKMFNKPKIYHNLIGTCYYVAPEVIFGGYHKQCDLWSCGIIYYVMLTGKFPFNGETDNEIYHQIKYENVDLECRELSNVSKEAKSMLQKLLEKDPIERINAVLSLEHPVFEAIKLLKKKSSNVILSRQGSRKVISQITYLNSGKLQQAITCFITNNCLSKEETASIKEVFTALDTNGDGEISLEELIEGYKAVGVNYNIQKISDILSGIDMDNSGSIGLYEFIAAGTDLEILLSDKNIERAFAKIDSDNSGSISLEELGHFIGGESYDIKLIKQLIEETGIFLNINEILFEDFKRFMDIIKHAAESLD